jgi:hypothetical protein
MLTQPCSRPHLVLLEAQPDRDCEVCTGTGYQSVFHPEMGRDLLDCPHCLGSGLNMLGLILAGVLIPPPEGFGPTQLEKSANRLISAPYLEQSP